MRFFLFASWLAALAVLSGPAAALDPVAALAIEEKASSGDRDGALALIEASLASEPAGADREALLGRKADLLEAAGRLGEAAQAAVALAEAMAARLGENAPGLIPVFRRVAALAETAGDAALSAEALGHALRVADAAGDTVTAAALAERLAALDGNAPALAAHRAATDAREAMRDLGPTAEGFTKVRLYYATDRAATGSTEPGEFYGSGRADGLSYGVLEVSVPFAHVPGAIEKPSIWTFDFREDPERHVVLQSVTPMAHDATFEAMRSHLAGTGSDEAFVFVHGFNVTFENAARRAAQIAHDMSFEGLPIVYSWPSRGSIFSYIADTAAVNLSGRRLLGFLEDVVRQSGARRIHLIAHSMGNRALTDALELYALSHRGEPPAFDQVLFTAPDLDAGLFKAMAHTIRPVARRLTLYSSDHDWALAVSRRLHGDMPRAGQGGQDILNSPDFDSVDMSLVGEDMLAHSYFANNPSALTDILSLFWRDAPPQKRCGMAAPDTARSWFLYTPERCDAQALLSALTLLRALPDGAEPRRDLKIGDATPEERARIESAVRDLTATQ